MKVYIPYHAGGAGKWIYEGYFAAWKHKGYDAEYVDFSKGLPSPPNEYEVMLVEGALHHIKLPDLCDFIDKASRVYLFVQPHSFPTPWGKHPNFISTASDEFVRQMNKRDNVYLWAFTNASSTDYYAKWKNVNYVPLAFDHLTYLPLKDPQYNYDICYIGGWANNGFDEKRVIMQQYLGPLSHDKNIKSAIVINQNCSLEAEMKLLYNSTLCLNIHDRYQQLLGLDSNERTFKSLGLNGFLISDKVAEVARLFPQVPQADTPEGFRNLVLEFLGEGNAKDLEDIKQTNRESILKDHTYICRVDQLQGLV